jgi:hypothetical protein
MSVAAWTKEGEKDQNRSSHERYVRADFQLVLGSYSFEQRRLSGDIETASDTADQLLCFASPRSMYGDILQRLMTHIAVRTALSYTRSRILRWRE